jgi:hypothetical protein
MRLLREPLLHFLLIGAALFAAYGWLNPGEERQHRIAVTQPQVDAMAAQFQATWQRPPTAEELRGLVDAWVRDEMLYREGEALGLQRDDPVIKRRVRQKYEVISEEALASQPPSDADLQAYLTAHAEAFRQAGRVSFEQVLVVATGSGGDAQAALDNARDALARGAEPARVGLTTMLPRQEDDTALDMVARDFGDEFAKQLESLPLNEWSGPVQSGFGLHFVRLSARSPGGVPPLADIRPAVVREWESARRREALDAQLQSLRNRYQVVMEADLAQVPTARVVAP